ncbi:MAG TPA: head GIN domain-containing protein [Pyrinomonadaceae bacterium]|nr:head GIN domain-containing protein [Pyrinomonadaceae bacterium]
MKKLLVIFLLVAPFAAACMLHHDQVIGSGQRQREKREVANFSSIRTEGAYQIEVVCQQALSLEVEADDNIMPLIKTDVSNGVLQIKSLRGFSANRPIVIKIGTPNIEGIYSSGASTIEVTGLKNDKFEIDSNGASTIKVAGETGTLDIDANGAGRIDAHKLRAVKGTVAANGVTKIEVHAIEELDVTVMGPASVIYTGDPKVNKTVHGPGSVERRASEGA